MSEEPREGRTGESGDEFEENQESGDHTGHDRYRPIDVRNGESADGRSIDRPSADGRTDGVGRHVIDSKGVGASGTTEEPGRYETGHRQRGSYWEERLPGHVGGERGDTRREGTVDDNGSLGDEFWYGSERGEPIRDRRYGSRRGNGTRHDPRRK